MRGYFGVGIYHPKTEQNIGTLWRSAEAFGASFICTIGRRYKKQGSDTTKTYRQIPLFHFEDLDDFSQHIPFGAELVAVEQTSSSVNLKEFAHPDRAVYLLGAEDHGLPPKILERCRKIVAIELPVCINVAVAGSIILFDRNNKATSV